MRNLSLSLALIVLLLSPAWAADRKEAPMPKSVVLENVDQGQSMTGTGQDRYALQDKMRNAWAAFARSGNPVPVRGGAEDG